MSDYIQNSKLDLKLKFTTQVPSFKRNF